jgi:glycosidase
MDGKEDPDNRRDFPGGFPGDKHNAFLAGQRTAREQRMWQWTRDWIKLRQEHSAIRRGGLIDLYYDDDVYVYARRDAKETVIIAINRSAEEKTIRISAAAINARDGERISPLNSAAGTVSVMNGQSVLILPAKMAVAYGIN